MFEDDRLSKTEDKKSLLYSENSIGDDELKQKGRMFDDNLPSKTENKNFLFYSPASKSDDELKQKGEMDDLKPSTILWKPFTTFIGACGKKEEGRLRDGKLFDETHRITFTEKTMKKRGRWTLHSFGDLDQIDHRWEVLKSLCESGVLASIISSTGTCNPRKGVTKCFTSDFENTKEVLRAAKEIRNLIDYEYVMYYATAEKTSGIEVMYNTRYIYTVKGGFYGKDKYMRWISLMT
ncbi:uncharacterized protein [Parasteatoda tepidariorum]|uniref:uncharacterized protein isoform X3 n=1 Tax=Parasteatoda tepidariorum TaxID=114398 RepID=UPI0039BD831C